VWRGAGGPVRIAPLFLLYDLHFPGAPGTDTKEASLAYAYETGWCVLTKHFLHPDPFPPGGVVPGSGGRDARRLDAYDSDIRLSW